MYKVKGGLGEVWEALCRLPFTVRDSPIRRIGGGEWLQSADPGVTIIVVVVVVFPCVGPRNGVRERHPIQGRSVQSRWLWGSGLSLSCPMGLL